VSNRLASQTLDTSHMNKLDKLALYFSMSSWFFGEACISLVSIVELFSSVYDIRNSSWNCTPRSCVCTQLVLLQKSVKFMACKNLCV
jgi:hypothetical protein